MVTSTTPKAKKLHWKFGTVLFSDSSAVDLMVIPKGSTIVQTSIMGAVAAGGTTPTLDVGIAGDADAYIDATDIDAAAVSVIAAPAVPQEELAADTVVQGIVSGGPSSGGPYTVGIGYIRDLSQ